MKVHVKLMATLRSKLPPEARGVTQVDLEPGATVAALIAKLGIGAEQVHAVMVNDSAEPDRQRPLTDGDSLLLLPPVAGG